MTAPPTVTADVLARIEQAEAVIWSLSDAAAHHDQVHVERFGGAWAFITPSQPNTLFNRCIGLGDDDFDQVERIEAFYRAHDVPPRFDLCPPRRSAAMVERLTSAGYEIETHPGFSRRFAIASPGTAADVDEPNGITIRPIGNPDDLDHFLSIQATIWPEDGPRTFARLQRLRASHGHPALRRYLAWADGSPVATAAMGVHEGVAFLFAGAVLKSHRKRGIQTAFLHRRLHDAHKLGTDLAATLVTPGSASERNLNRAGFATACDRELWLPKNWTDSTFYRDTG